LNYGLQINNKNSWIGAKAVVNTAAIWLEKSV